MSEETTTLLFESEIVANIDTRSAMTKLTNLNKKVGEVEGTITSVFASMNRIAGKIEASLDSAFDYTDTISSRMRDIADDLNYYESTLRDIEKQHREVGEAVQEQVAVQRQATTTAVESNETWVQAEQVTQKEVRKTISAIDDLDSRIRTLMSRYSGRAKKVGPEAGTFGTFKGEKVVSDALTSMIEMFQSQYKDIGLEKILSRINKVVEENSSVVASGANRTTEQVEAAWKNLKYKLFGDPIIIDIVDAMEHHLVKRMEKIINRHKAMVGEDLLKPYEELGVSAADALKEYSAILDDILKVDPIARVAATGRADPVGIVRVFERIKSEVQELKAEIALVGLELKEGLVDPITDSVELLVAAVSTLPDEAKDVARQLRAGFVDPVKRSFDGLIYAIGTIPPEIKRVGGELKGAFIDPITIGFARLSGEIKAVAGEIRNNFVAEIKKVPGDLGKALIDLTTRALNSLPIAVHRKVATAARAALDAGQRIGQGISSGISMAVDATRDFAANLLSTLQPIGDRISDTIKDSLRPLADEMKRIGLNAANNLTDSIVQGIQDARPKVVAATKEITNAITSGLKYTAGSVLDVLTFKGLEERLRRRYARAGALGLEETRKHVRREMDYHAVDIDDFVNTTNHQLRAFRESWWDAAQDIGLAVSTMISGQIPFRQSLGGVGVAFDKMFAVIGRGLGVQQKYSSVQKDLDGTLRLVTQSLSGYRRENEILDKGLQRIATSVDNTADSMKKQGQEIIKQQERRRQGLQEQMVALSKWTAAYEYATQVQAKGLDATDTEWARVKKRMTDAVKELERFGLASVVYKDIGGDTKKLAEEIEKLGKKTTLAGNEVRTGMGENFRSVFKNVEKMFGEMENQAEKMLFNFPKQLSMWNRAIQDVEQESKHFLTTLRDGGKISTERLQDLLLAYQNLAKEARENRKLGIFIGDPQMAKWWENVERNSLLAVRNFTLMAQRARTVEAVKEKLFGTTKKVTNSIISLGQAAGKHIPIIGEKARVSQEQMEKFSAATEKVRGSSSQLTFALQSLDPVMGDLGQSIGDVGSQFGAVMDGMAEVAAVKTGSMIKTFTALKIAMVGILGIFGALIVSTGKLAAEITTLNITMKTVGTNLGVPISYLENLIEVLKETGITTKEATIAVTQWMRANLAFEWEDPITKTAYAMDDLARAAQQMAVAMGENSSEMFARFIDFVQTGNSQLLDSAGIMKNSTQMYEEYAKAIGVSVKALSIRQKQEALISGLMRESTKLQGVYTEAMKSASKQLGSMKRYIEELRYEWGKHFEPILALIIFRFNQLLKFLAGIPESTKKTVTTFITIATAVSGLVLGLSFLIPKLKVVLGLFKAMSGLLLGKFGLLLTLLTAVAAVFSRWFMKIEVESDGVQGLVDRVDKILESFGGLKKIIEPVERWLRSFFAMISYHVERIKFLVDELVVGFSEWVQRFRQENPELVSLIERTKTVFEDLFAVIWRVVDLILDAIEALLGGDWEQFFDKVKLVGKYILAWFLEFFLEVVVAAATWGKNIITAFAAGIMQQAKAIIPRVMTAIGNLLSAFLEGHSPTKIGPLSQIDIWGEGIMDTFLKSMMGRKFRFDEDMFEGIGSLQVKAKTWGDNIVDVFTYGITGKATQAIAPAMNYVGQLIARFLEGHSPPEVGPLSEIMNWGRNAFEAFLEGFEMADFSFLDRALDLIRRKLQLVVKDGQDAGKKLAQAMVSARTFIAGAVSGARATGGPLDLSGMKEVVLGPLRIFAKDVGSTLEALFDAMKAEASYEFLQEKIEKSRKAREDAIKALEDRHKAIEEEINALVKARAEAAGLVYDERLVKELQRQLADASRDVQDAQRRLSSVQKEAGRYGVNVLTWEQINAQAQADLAERRRDEIQEQIDAQEEVQSEIERIRYEIEGQYIDELNALEARAEQLKKINEARTKVEEAQLEKERERYEAAQEAAEYLALLLEQRLAYEEELKRANEEIVDKTSRSSKSAKGAAETIAEEMENVYEGLEGVADTLAGIGWPDIIDPPDLSDIFQKYFGQLFGPGGVFDAKGKTFGEWLKETVESVWGKFKQTKVGQVLGDLGIIEILEGIVTAFGNITIMLGKIVIAISKVEWPDSKPLLTLKAALAGIGSAIVIAKLPLLLGAIASGIETVILAIMIGLGGGGISGALSALLAAIGGPITLLAALVGGLVFLIIRHGPAAWETLKQLFAIFLYHVDQVYGAFELLGVIIGHYAEKIANWFGGIGDSIAGFFTGISDKVSGAIRDFVDMVVGFFNGLVDILIGNSIIPDLINGIVQWFCNLPGMLLGFATDLLNAAIKLGNKIYTGIKSGVDSVINGIGTWIDSVITNIKNKAQAVWDGVVEMANSIVEGIRYVITDEDEGVVAKIGGWLDSVIGKIKDKAMDFLDGAKKLAWQIFQGIKHWITNKEEGIVAKIGGWIDSVITEIKNKAVSFFNNAKALGWQIYLGFKYWITDPVNGIVAKVSGWFSSVISKIAGVAKGIWNEGLRPGLQGVLNKVAKAINSIIDIINNAASFIGLGNTWPFPIGHVSAPELPSLQVGGIVLDDIVAQLHAGEVVMPLDRLESVMRGMGLLSTQVPPIFAPVMNFYPGASPQQIVPAVDYAYSLYEERLRSGQ